MNDKFGIQKNDYDNRKKQNYDNLKCLSNYQLNVLRKLGIIGNSAGLKESVEDVYMQKFGINKSDLDKLVKDNLDNVKCLDKNQINQLVKMGLIERPKDTVVYTEDDLAFLDEDDEDEAQDEEYTEDLFEDYFDETNLEFLNNKNISKKEVEKSLDSYFRKLIPEGAYEPAKKAESEPGA